MLWRALFPVVAHGGDLDIHLLGWITDLVRNILGFDDWTVVALTGGVILVIPVVLVALYLSQRKGGNYDPVGD